MTHHSHRLTETERASIVAALTDIQARLEEAREFLATVQIRFAIESLNPASPLNDMGTHQAA